MYKITIKELVDFQDHEIAIYKDILFKTEEVINSEQFKDRVLNHQYRYRANWWSRKTKLKTGFYDTTDTTEEVYNRFMEADEKGLNEGVDYEADVYAKMYYQDSNVVGKIVSGEPYLYINRKYFTLRRTAKIAGNFAHEQCHRLGYSHSFFNNNFRKYSVPYGVGEIVTDLFKG